MVHCNNWTVLAHLDGSQSLLVTIEGAPLSIWLCPRSTTERSGRGLVVAILLVGALFVARVYLFERVWNLNNYLLLVRAGCSTKNDQRQHDSTTNQLDWRKRSTTRARQNFRGSVTLLDRLRRRRPRTERRTTEARIANGPVSSAGQQSIPSRSIPPPIRVIAK